MVRTGSAFAFSSFKVDVNMTQTNFIHSPVPQMLLFLYGDNERYKHLHVTPGSRWEIPPVIHVIVAAFGHSVGPAKLWTPPLNRHYWNGLVYELPHPSIWGSTSISFNTRQMDPRGPRCSAEPTLSFVRSGSTRHSPPDRPHYINMWKRIILFFLIMT
jgi:hypothetical protein